MHSVRIALLLTLAAAGGRAQVTPALLERLPGNTQVVSGIQVQAFLASPFGKFLFTQIPAQNPLAQMAAMTGFDLQRDLQEVVIGGGGIFGASTPLVVLRGTFPIEQFTDFARKAGAGTTTFQGVTLITPQQKNQPSLALLDASTIAFGDAATLSNLIDHTSGGIAPALADKARAVSAGRDVWFATVTPLSGMMPVDANDPRTQMLQGIRETSGGAHFNTDTVDLGAEALTASENDAQVLAGMLRLITSMAAGKQAPVLKNISFQTEGSSVKLQLSVAEQDLEQMTKAKPR
jgi:hypothetical protein